MPLATLLFAGDVMLNGVRPSERVFAGIAPVVRRADLAFANFEIPLTTAATPTVRKTREEIKRRDQFVLKADPGHAPFFARAGFDVVSLANNHTMDYGAAGMEQTQSLLEGQRIAHTGAGATEADAMRPTFRVLPDGTRVGLVSAMAFVTTSALWKITPATKTEPGVNAFAFNGNLGKATQAKLREYLGRAKKRCDVLVVAVHWGTERKTVPNPYQVNLGRTLIDSGADVVWGHHPHVLQGAELYRGKPIFYSTGNLISALPAETGLIQMTGRGKRASFQFFPARIRAGQVRLLSEKEAPAARKRFAALCQQVVKRYPHRQTKALF